MLYVSETSGTFCVVFSTVAKRWNNKIPESVGDFIMSQILLEDIMFVMTQIYSCEPEKEERDFREQNKNKK